MLTPRTPLLAAALLAVVGASPLHAQGGLFGRIKDKAKEKVEEQVGKKVEHAADTAHTSPAGGGSTAGATQAGTASASAAPPIAFVNYDFVPGDRVLFAEDFSADQVGDLPARVKVMSGNWEVADYMGRRFLRSTSGGQIMIPLPSVLPDRFTFEADVIHAGGWDTDFWFVPDAQREGHERVFTGYSGGVGPFHSTAADNVAKKLYHVRIMADGEHVKVYENGKRVANAPEGKLGRANAVWIHGTGSDDNPFYLTNIRIAESQKKLFDVLNASGRAATHGILFDVNSDNIRPESAPTLKEIGDMLTAHPDLKLTIEGHTDNSGDATANQALSEQRAAAVKTYLVATFHVDAGRLQTKGFGASKPAASNDTPEGRQQNRRVELVRN